MTKAVVLLSGGLDSTTLLYHLDSQGYELLPISFDYGQRHKKEILAAATIAKGLNLPHKVVDLSNNKFLFEGSALTSDIEVPEGHYTDKSMSITVVPNRNMVMLSLATAYAISQGADSVAYAAHAGDHAIYPDCRPVFVEAMRTAIILATEGKVLLVEPFINWSKAGIVKRGSEIGVPYHLTWSCYNAGLYHCGKCGTCYERREAFQLAGVKDPTVYIE